tara:strand:- start:53 stop:442 length:390 start_codon:yes stop_codon:yes gene_type:complete
MWPFSLKKPVEDAQTSEVLTAILDRLEKIDTPAGPSTDLQGLSVTDREKLDELEGRFEVLREQCMSYMRTGSGRLAAAKKKENNLDLDGEILETRVPDLEEMQPPENGPVSELDQVAALMRARGEHPII